ncbi:MAG: winged helix-turn-helix domain-containing protein [Nitrosotalea sp.]
MSQQKSVYSQVIEEHLYQNKKKRTELGQLVQILEYLRSSNDTIISSVSRFTNMSHNSATRNCEKLVNAGLASKEITGNNKKYRVTSEGFLFLDNCKNFWDILSRYKLSDLLY